MASFRRMLRMLIRGFSSLAVWEPVVLRAGPWESVRPALAENTSAKSIQMISIVRHFDLDMVSPFKPRASYRRQWPRKGSRRNKFTFWRERLAGRCEAPPRGRCRTSSRSGNNADTRPSPPRPSELRPAGLQQNAKFISARALRSPTSAVAVQVKMGLVNRRVRRPGLESSLQASLTRYRLSLNSEPGSSEDE